MVKYITFLLLFTGVMTRPVFAVDTLNVQAITKQFAELLGGSIGVESQVGKGSTFRVRVLVVYREG